MALELDFSQTRFIRPRNSNQKWERTIEYFGLIKVKANHASWNLYACYILNLKHCYFRLNEHLLLVWNTRVVLNIGSRSLLINLILLRTFILDIVIVNVQYLNIILGNESRP